MELISRAELMWLLAQHPCGVMRLNTSTRWHTVQQDENLVESRSVIAFELHVHTCLSDVHVFEA